MATVGFIEYFVVEGTLADMATFNADVDAQIDLGYISVDEPQTDGTDIWLVMMKGSPASFVAEYEIVSLGSVLTSGFQRITASDPIAAGDDAITTLGTYYFKVAVDGGPVIEYNVVVGATRTYAQITSDIDTAVSAAGITVTFDDANDQFVFTSDSSGSGSSISVTEGTTGTDIFTQMVADDATLTAPWTYEAPVAGTDDDDSTFEIEGNHILNFQAGYKFTVTRSTANDGVYTVAPGGSTFVTPNTVIPVNEAVADETVDGYIEGWSPSVGP
jgi:hypothetical protein